MKKRITKKIAKEFLLHKKTRYGVAVRCYDAEEIGAPASVITVARFPISVIKEAYRLIKRYDFNWGWRRWNWRHWENPFILDEDAQDYYLFIDGED